MSRIIRHSVGAFTVTHDLSGLDAQTKNMIAGTRKLPRGLSNPLVRSAQWYRMKLYNVWWHRRPTIGQSASWMGNHWRRLKPQYIRGGTRGPSRYRAAAELARLQGRGIVLTPSAVRKAVTRRHHIAGGEAIPVWGGVSKVVGRGKVKAKKKKRPVDSRYKKSDKQLNILKGEGMLNRFATDEPFISADGRKVVVGSDKPYALYQARMRRWHWSDSIGREVAAKTAEECKAYIEALGEKHRK